MWGPPVKSFGVAEGCGSGKFFKCFKEWPSESNSIGIKEYRLWVDCALGVKDG